MTRAPHSPDTAPVTLRLAPRPDAYETLGVTREAVAALPLITPQIRSIQSVLRKHNATASEGSELSTSPVDYLHASDAPEARLFIDAYYLVGKTHKARLPLEAFCAKAGVSPLRILEIIVAGVVRISALSSNIIAAVTHPSVVEKTVDMALTDEGHQDRVVLHKATGFLPTPRGPHTQVTVNAAATANSSAQAAAATVQPQPEVTIRRMVDRFNDARRLDAGSSELPPASALPIPAVIADIDTADLSDDADEQP